MLAGTRRAVQRQLPLHPGRGRGACSATMGARAVIYERGLADKLHDVAAELDLLHRDRRRVRRGRRSPARSAFEADDRRRPPGPDLRPRPPRVCGPDDRYLACTGGTTGRPKGVLWRQGDIFVAAMGGADGMTAADAPRARAVDGGGVWFPTSPLMHVAAQWTAMVAHQPGRDRGPARRLPAVRHDDDPRDRGTRARELHDHRRRRVRAADGRTARPAATSTSRRWS